MTEGEPFIPCLIDPRCACRVDCGLHAVAVAKAQYMERHLRIPITQDTIITVFEKKSERQIARFITERMTMIETTNQLDKCYEIVQARNRK